MGFIKHLNMTIRGKKDDLTWLQNINNYAFLKEVSTESAKSVEKFCRYTVESYYQILLKPSVDGVEYTNNSYTVEDEDITNLLSEIISNDVWINKSNYNNTQHDIKVVLDLIVIGLLVAINRKNLFEELKDILSEISHTEVNVKDDLVIIYEILSTKYSAEEKNNIIITDEKVNQMMGLLDFNLVKTTKDDENEINYIKTNFKNSHHVKDYLINDNNYEFFKIENKLIEEKFNPKELYTQLLVHGTKKKNILSILNSGIASQPGYISSGSMLGVGAYFARLDEVGKSMQYADQFLLVAEVATGKEYKLSAPCDGRKLLISNPEYQSVHCVAGPYLRHDEYCIYHDNQIKVKYLIQIKPTTEEIE